MPDDEKKKSSKKEKRVAKPLRPLLNDDPNEMKERMETMKLWFECNFPLDDRAEVIAEIQKIIAVSTETLDTLPVGRLINAETKLIQYRTTLGSLIADTLAGMNFAYVYRKFQYSNVWTKHRDAMLAEGGKTTNGEMDNLAQVAIYEERCIEILTQQRADLYKNIDSAARSYLNNITHRINQKSWDQKRENERRIYENKNS